MIRKRSVDFVYEDDGEDERRDCLVMMMMMIMLTWLLESGDRVGL